MTPAWVQILLFAVQQALKEVPGLVAEFEALFSKDEITDADWEALRARVNSLDYHKLVPNTDLPPEPPTAPAQGS